MKLLAEGGTSLIYRARDMLAITGPDDGQSHIALKVIKPDMASYAEDLAFYESLSTRHLSHPNIVKVFDFHRDNGLSFVSMELLEGESVAQLMRRYPDGGLEKSKAYRIFNEVCQALEYAHGKGIIHSDIKPSNVLVLEDGSIKVIDFATSRSFLEAGVRQNATAGSYFGYTLSYASPDISRSLEADPADDVFSLGCLLFEMLAGKHPFGRKPSSELTEADMPKRPASISLWTWMVLQKALHPERSRRIGSVASFRRLIRATRKVGPGVAAASTLVIALTTGGLWLNDYVDGRQQYQQQLVDVYQQQQQQQALQQRFAALPVSVRLEYLNELQQTNESGLALVKPMLLESLDNKVEQTLAAVDGDDVPDFNAIDTEITRLAAVLPDSLQLDHVRRDVSQRREQLIDLYNYRLAQDWSDADFSTVSANRIVKSMQRLQQLDGHFPWDDAYLEHYRQMVSEALEQQDFVQLGQLYSFAEVVQQGFPVVASVWQALPAETLDHARALLAFLDQRSQLEVDGDASTLAYPDDSVRFLAAEELTTLREQLSKSWLDKQIVEVWEQVEALADRFAMPPQSKVLQGLADAMLLKIDAKMAYHKQKGYSESYARLASLKQTVMDRTAAVGEAS
ncbi:serine/threonine-protein kinase [Oceanobacter mangrovi]|uniref:serine/threonine-protein kinase n=1 Tax=Oceanobacter mangrovi TaxID=2862510 RepID=UPI002484B5BE|nr:serine/threonine-protein kinase [Oceanobacter mangrovi]